MTDDDVPVQRCATNKMGADHIEAVERSIRHMRGNIGDEHSLRNLARSALLSPFHFHRVFRQITDSTPARYLAAWRMAEAKQLLASSSENVTDICMRVGYSSLGTFTSQFGRLVGISPRRFRQLVTDLGDEPFHDVLQGLRGGLTPPRVAQVRGTISGGSGALALVGLFVSGIPQERPAACAIVQPPSALVFGGLPDGEFHPFAVGCPRSVRVRDMMVGDDDELTFLASTAKSIIIAGGRCVSEQPFELTLRRRHQLDPPMVSVLPLLVLAESGYLPGLTTDPRSPSLAAQGISRPPCYHQQAKRRSTRTY